MNEFLVAYSEFDTDDLARQIHDAARQSEELLRVRHLLGPIARYGASLQAAAESVLRGQSETDPMHFAVVNEMGDVVGAASIYENLKLGRTKLPLPPGLLRPGDATKSNWAYLHYGCIGMNVSAWVKPSDSELLWPTYQALVDISKVSSWSRRGGDDSSGDWIWTVEPALTLAEVHTAIKDAGLRPVGKMGRYDDHEPGRRIPPRGYLYIARGRLALSSTQEIET